jgi:hypothetical protein
MSLIQQSGDTDLVNILQGSTAGLGNTGPNIFNPQNILNITVLIPQRISVQQLGNSEELSRVSQTKVKIKRRNFFYLFI